ncbi:MAG: PD-(D/E)XK nuclease family protein [Saprospiraceae bacterium]|nr:PD-(D/E)XK nuclease family protein [Saprospiraceae bacterium]MCF8249521.1 PD-(D/E)XK nuclease family protein [Saprospiraceae bacterium]MCF8280146.1 PD-(D/E)XK nuclease family protein [Bacteroidales bacterium]MCF8310739.1 PD-(D/E)XK nuclease family protein [Saprospiraceae bacterium]MCF8439430.1 PD-(D/E)XK nuclease family protein [Saprospiraceae bacterium]
MKLIFGLQLDNPSLPRPDTEAGVHYVGPKGLLALFETWHGLGGHPNDIDYLRTEQYRQALLIHLADAAAPVFYQKSFEADPFTTAADLCSRRDELLLAGWDFQKKTDTPPRLATIAEIEAIFQTDPEVHHLDPGFADRFDAVLRALNVHSTNLSEIWVNEPLDLMPQHFQRFFEKLAETAALEIQQLPLPELPTEATTDLQKFQTRFSAAPTKTKETLQNDGSLLLLQARRSSEAAAWVAQLVRVKLGIGKSKIHASKWGNWGIGGEPIPQFPHSPIPQFPTFLIPEKSRTLDMALIQEGQPSLGIQSTSLARPTLQVLKLVTAFLWEPVNPFHILEFVSLAVKPLADDLATLIANQVAATPGLQGDGWYAMINRYFEELAENEPLTTVNEQRKQYNFWFERRRYDMGSKVPKVEVTAIFDYLRQWAVQAFEDGGGRNHSLIVLSQQARRVSELLNALPEQELTHLELERIVRTIYEPSPVVLQPQEAGSLPYVQHPGAFTGAVGEVWWWNFVQQEQPHFFSKWSKSERAWLAQMGVLPDTPEQENARQLWQQSRPVLAATDRLVLVLPESVDGTAANPHPLFGDLQAAFSNLEAITQQVGGTAQAFAKHFTLPTYELVELRQLGRPAPFLKIKTRGTMQRERESLTSLEALFYYPYQWFFKYKIRLNKSSILSVVPDNTLMGNLAHRIFEKLLKEDIHAMSKAEVESRVEQESRRLLVREGAVLLMYGREPDRVAFVNKLKFAAWSLVTHIRDNGWRVLGTEQQLDGRFPHDDESSPEVRGIADLVLERTDPNGTSELAVVDIKWRGSGWRESVIRNGEDLQLVLYARLVSPENEWAHTAYFIVENGKLLARNSRAFQNISPISPMDDHREVNEGILAQMHATWQWRMAQLSEGLIEVRCRQTLAAIEGTYGEDHGAAMSNLLEMKGEDAKYDDYRVLINLID